jgi:hypothetical protein
MRLLASYVSRHKAMVYDKDWHWGGWLVGYDGGHALHGVAEAGRGEGGFDSPGFVIFIALLVEF